MNCGPEKDRFCFGLEGWEIKHVLHGCDEPIEYPLA